MVLSLSLSLSLSTQKRNYNIIKCAYVLSPPNVSALVLALCPALGPPNLRTLIGTGTNPLLNPSHPFD